MTKVLTAALVSVLLALAGLGYLYKRQSTELHAQIASVATLTAERDTLVQAQKQAEKRRKSDRKVLVATQAKIAVQGRKLAQAEATLSEALQRNKSWSDTDVPDAVQKALHGAADGLGGGAPGERVHE